MRQNPRRPLPAKASRVSKFPSALHAPPLIVVKIYMLVVRNYLSDWGRHCAWQVGELFFESWQNAPSDIAQKGRVDVSKLDVDVGRVLEEG